MDDLTHAPRRTDDAPGAPGIPPAWCSSAKDMVGCALGPSRLWFTIGHGIVNEVYHPRVDHPADPRPRIHRRRLEASGLRSNASNYTRGLLAPGIPAVAILHHHERFAWRCALLPIRSATCWSSSVELTPATGGADLGPYVLLAPHLGGTGHDQAAVGEHYGIGECCGPSRDPSGSPWLQSDTRQGDALGVPVPGTSGPATDGRISPATGR